MASAWNLPVIFIAENNQYGMSVPWAKVTKLPDIAQRACAYGIPGEAVDGMDAIVVRESVSRAIDRARRGEGPTLIEAKTYAISGIRTPIPGLSHQGRGKGMAGPRPDRGSEERHADDRLAGRWPVRSLDKAVEDKMAAAMAFAEASPAPDPAEAYTDVFSPAKTTAADVTAEVVLREQVRNATNMRVITYVQALVEAQREEMQRDPKVFIMGEDVGLNGGAYARPAAFGRSSATGG